ncbi:NrfD/PsrC family molybdoenzyme membrane anchor subunit [Seonamhaeicola aphaedonensis]|uniref:Molybdopterin-containing oxidoreductase family membrane subunit n=1 Tax=Seonamhaeicola aphaedonensis TaxID=1461338 RepID=A0A3D9H5D0_9FLAO|nr:NrfD/PsrC family molybdoenzyme membrane anchor subunit [Seonamhaeicola aphaedonensis]RED44725.1 molybdopterin-containing oxidoreductase family membrane subunit [Seonamhaeicola aphaedonensis]
METNNKIINDLVPKKFTKRGIIWTTFLIALIVIGLIAYIDQLIKGQEVTNMRDYALWGIYISNFVFFVATSFVGTVTVAILRLTNNSWRTPLVRIAEIIALAAIIMAGITIIIDMARPDRLLNLFIHARLQSPITWDVVIIPTYIVISLLLLYFPLIPDFAILKNHFKQSNSRWSKIYGKLALNWTGSIPQKILQEKSIKIIAIMIIPVGLLLQTIDAWLFSTTYRIGWDSTNFAPYFISGAFVAGVGALATLIYVVRKVKKLEEYITDYHFDKMGKLLALACLIYLYFNINEYLIPLFTAKKGELTHLETLFTGSYSGLFWLVTIGGLILPIIILLFKKGRQPRTMFYIGLLVVIGSWWKRFVIVTPTLLHPFLPIQGVPESWHHYFPSLHEWLITIATLAMALLIITICVRFLPVIPIQRTIDELQATNANGKNLES